MAAFAVAIASFPSWYIVIGAFRTDDTAPFVTFAPYGLAGGGLLTVAGLAALSAFLLHPAGKRPLGAGSILSGLGGLGVGGCAVGLVFALVTIPPVDAATAGRQAEPGPVPDQVQEIGWRWEVQDGSTVRDARSAGDGAVVLTNDGVYGLDTSAGEERWHYRREGEETVELRVSPGGEAALATFLATDHAGDDTLRVVALDAHTGRVRSDHEYIGSWAIDPDLGSTKVAKHSYVDFEWEERDEGTNVFALAAYDLDSGSRSWSFVPPENCDPDVEALREEIVVTMLCHEDFSEFGLSLPPRDEAIEIDVVVLGLSPDGGDELWRHEEQVVTDGWVDIHSATDGRALALEWQETVDESPVQSVVLGEGGEILEHDTPVRHIAQIQTHGTEGGRTITDGAFTAEGYLRDEDSDSSDFTWEPFDGEPREAQIPDIGSYVDAGPVPLADMLLSARRFDEGQPLAVHGTPWNGEEADSVEIPLDFDHPDGGLGRVRLFPAPDATVAATSGAPTVFGLQ